MSAEQKGTPAERARRGAALAELARLDAPEVMDLPPRQTTNAAPVTEPPRMVLVPAEATRAMVWAAMNRPQPDPDSTMYPAIWRAMVAAAEGTTDV